MKRQVNVQLRAQRLRLGRSSACRNTKVKVCLVKRKTQDCAGYLILIRHFFTPARPASLTTMGNGAVP
jgi:hypothetical protein